jgi:hypothetical protein
MIQHCQRCESPLEADDLRCAVCGLPTPVVLAPVLEEAAQILRCHGCGAAVSYSAEAQAPRCDFCGSVMEVEVPEDPIEEASHFVNFRVPEAEAREALQRWLGSLGFFRPPDLQSQSTIAQLRPLWWVGWMFDARVVMHWAADSNAGAQRSAWAPHSGQGELELRRVVVSASRGLTEKECSALVPHYNVEDVADAPTGHVAATVETFAVQRSAARRLISQSLESVAAQHARPMVPGSECRNLHVSVLPTRLTSSHYAFPAWVLAYRYKGELYRAIIHGQDPRCVSANAPYSWTRILMVAGGSVVLLLIIGLIAAALAS